MNSPDLTGKVALVTGGAIRVGAAIALRLARQGMDLAITYRSSDEQAKQVVAQIEQAGRRAVCIRADFEQPDAADQLADEVARAFDRLDVLVNNASVFEATAFGSITRDDYERQMRINAWSPLQLIQRLAPRLGEHYRADDPASAGRVINFIDIHVMGEPLKGYAAYNASKAALQEITMTSAVELAPRVTVNALAPGVVAWADVYSEAMKRNYLARVPLARAGTPQDAADAALYLVRDAHYQTGQIIRLDGGRHLT